MTRLVECLKSLFGTTNLYEVLNTGKDSSVSEIKKAYYKVSLLVHPDRANEDDRSTATKKFQAVSQVYRILSNPDKRTLYDQSGEIDDDSDTFEENKDWDSYWRILFKKISIADIENFAADYRHSEKERDDVVTAYMECNGDMDLMLERIPCCNVEDDARFKEIIEEKVTKGEIPAFKKENSKTRAKRRKMAKIEEQEAAEIAKEMGLGKEEDQLKTMIEKRQVNRQKEMESFFDHLASKYANSSKKVKLSSGKKVKSRTKK